MTISQSEQRHGEEFILNTTDRKTKARRSSRLSCYLKTFRGVLCCSEATRSFIHPLAGRLRDRWRKEWSGAAANHSSFLFFPRSPSVSAFAPGLSARTFVRSLCYFGCYFRSAINLSRGGILCLRLTRLSFANVPGLVSRWD